MVNKMCSIYREKKEVKKNGKSSNGHMTVGKGEIDNITVRKGGGGVWLKGKGEGLIACLLVAEQNNELLLKNHQSRPTGSIPLP